MEEFAVTDSINVRLHPSAEGSEGAEAYQRAIKQIAATPEGQIMFARLQETRNGRPLDIVITGEGDQSSVYEGPNPEKGTYGQFTLRTRNLTNKKLNFRSGFWGAALEPMSPQRVAFHEIYHAAAGHGPVGRRGFEKGRKENVERSTRDISNRFLEKYYGLEKKRRLLG